MTKIAIFILPKNKIKRKISLLKKKVKKNFGQQPYLSHPPHCTLFTMNVSRNILNKKKYLNNFELNTNYKNFFKIIKPDIFYNDPITRGRTIFFKIKKNSFLEILQLKLLKEFSKYKKKDIGKKFKFKWMNINNRKYGYPFVGNRWKPHFTIASLKNTQNDKQFIKNFLKIKIKAKIPIKKVHIYKLIKERHIYLWSINIKLK